MRKKIEFILELTIKKFWVKITTIFRRKED